MIFSKPIFFFISVQYDLNNILQNALSNFETTTEIILIYADIKGKAPKTFKRSSPFRPNYGLSM